MLELLGHAPLCAVATLASRILPAVEPKLIVPITSPPTGNGEPHGEPLQLVPDASCTKKYCPGSIVPESAVTCHVPVPVALVYCTDQPDKLMVVAPTFNNSI